MVGSCAIGSTGRSAVGAGEAVGAPAGTAAAVDAAPSTPRTPAITSRTMAAGVRFIAVLHVVVGWYADIVSSLLQRCNRWVSRCTAPVPGARPTAPGGVRPR